MRAKHYRGDNLISTITLNPSIDKTYVVNNFHKNGVFRVNEMVVSAGGKGLNVSRVITQLGEKVIATGLLGGKSGEFIEEEIINLGIINEFVKIQGETRSCIAITSQDLSQTEILEPGPIVKDEELISFYNKYDELLDRSDIICASGSLPQNVPIEIYSDLIIKAKKKNKKFILDASGKPLKQGLLAKPYLIKPNRDELNELAGKTLHSEEDFIKYGQLLSKEGIEVVVISLGGDGALAFNNNNIYKISIPKIEIKSTVGSGDSMIAGFAVGINRGYSFEDTLKLAAACGTANALEKITGTVNIENVKRIKDEIKINIIN